MNRLWPRLSAPVAGIAFEEMGSRSVLDLAQAATHRHPRQTFAATGGVRVAADDLAHLAGELREVAREYGYPDSATDDQRIAFDRAAAEQIFRLMPMTSVEASNRGVWTFVSVVLLPDVTLWRFGRGNKERWIASDLTRHMFSRLWWQALTFGVPDGRGGSDFALLRGLQESELNQITERRTIGGNQQLAQALARKITADSGMNREVLRAMIAKLRRRLAFIDYSALTGEQIDDQIRSLLR